MVRRRLALDSGATEEGRGMLNSGEWRVTAKTPLFLSNRGAAISHSCPAPLSFWRGAGGEAMFAYGRTCRPSASLGVRVRCICEAEDRCSQGNARAFQQPQRGEIWLARRRSLDKEPQRGGTQKWRRTAPSAPLGKLPRLRSTGSH
jgi:hypothetical protein